MKHDDNGGKLHYKKKMCSSCTERKTNICSGSRLMSKKLFLNRAERNWECIGESSMPSMCLCMHRCIGVWFFSTFSQMCLCEVFPTSRLFLLPFVLQPCGLFLSSFLSNRFKTLLWKHHFWFFPVKYFSTIFIS